MFKKYAGLILAVVSMLVSWEVSAGLGIAIAVVSFYVSKHMEAAGLRVTARGIDVVTIALSLLVSVI